VDDAAYFAAQERKSERKVSWEYGRLLTLAGRPAVRGSTVLDAGCGAGPGLRFFVAQGSLTYGLDASFYALERARASVPAAHLVQGDLQAGLPFVGRRFDLVVLGDVIEHLTDGVPLLRECRRALRPGGVLLVRTVNRWDVRRHWQGARWSGVADPTHVHLYSPPELQRALREAGFTRVRTRTGVKPMLWLPVRWPIGIPWPPWVGNGLLGLGYVAE
jgi:SAM-dependent methyltransferase